jgi:putative membrane protein
MIISFSKNLRIQITGIVRKNFSQILFFTFWGLLVYMVFHYFRLEAIRVPISAVSIIGGALAFFLAFRNNSAYDRWWEARKIWGGIVNISRTFAGYTTNIIPPENDQQIKIIVRRHLAWINALRIQLREQDHWDDIFKYLSPIDIELMKISKNRATQLVQKQMGDITKLKRDNQIDHFEHQMMMDCLREMYELQGKAERIKKTVFPYYYEYFTRFFLWVFILFLPLSLVPLTGWHSLPLSVITSFVFFILERTGAATETPLDWNSSGTPMTTLCRIIEIDVLQQAGERDLPKPREVQVTRNGSLFLD